MIALEPVDHHNAIEKSELDVYSWQSHSSWVVGGGHMYIGRSMELRESLTMMHLV